MKKLISIFTTIILSITLLSQNIDSILLAEYQKLKQEGKKIEAVHKLRELVHYWLNINPLTASMYAAQANQEAQTLGDSMLIALTYNDMGLSYLEQKSYFMATEAFFKAYDIYLALNAKKEIGYTLLNIGQAYLKQGIADIAEDKFQQALKIFEELNDIQGKALAYRYLGLANLKTDEQLAINYFKNAIEILKKLKSKNELATTYYFLAESYYQIGYNDSSIIYANLALQLFNQLKNKYYQGKIYLLFAKNYFELNDLPTAEQYVNKAISIFNLIQNHENLAASYLLKAQIFNKYGNWNTAITYANKAIEIAESFRYLEILSDSYQLLANIYAKHQDYKKAFEYQSLYAQTLIKLFEEKKQQHFSSFQMNLETQNKERQIELLKIQAEKERLLRDKEMYRRNFFYILIIVFLIVLFVVFLIARFREKVKTTRLLESTNALLREEIEMRKKTEQDLKNSEERYRLLFRKTPVGIMQYDENMIIIDANDRFAEIFHLPRKQVINQPLDKIFDRKILEIFKKAIETETEIYSEQVEILTSHGIVYVLLTIKPYIFTKDDKVIKSAIVIVQDITQQKKAEQLYKDTMLRKQKLLDLLPDSLILVNSKGEILEVHLPHSPDKEVGVKHLSELLPQHTIRLFMNELDLAIRRKHIRKFIFTSTKGNQLLARIVPDKTGNALIIISQVPQLEAEVSESTLHTISQEKLEARQKFHKNLENIIENELIPMYQNLQRALSFIILKNFIERLNHVAKQFKLSDLEQYSEKLKIALEEFDVPKVNELLAQFPALIGKYVGYETVSL